MKFFSEVTGSAVLRIRMHLRILIRLFILTRVQSATFYLDADSKLH
jgi:hypothetical protein